MEDLYTRQQEIGLTIPNNITIAGVGGIGSWVAILAAMSGVQNLYLFDPDTMEEHNRNRLPFCEGSLNRPKVDVVREYITSIRPNAIVVAVQEKLEGVLLDIQIGSSTAIIDCTDSPKAQFNIYNKCKENGRIKYIRAGYDGTSITVTGAISGWIKTTEEEEDYTVNPSWVVPAVTVAALAVGKLEKYFDQEVACDISEIGIAVLQRKRRLTARCRQEGGTRTTTRSRAAREEGEYMSRWGVTTDRAAHELTGDRTNCALCGEDYMSHSGWRCNRDKE